MHLNLPDDRQLSLDFEPLLSMAQDINYHLLEIIDQVNGHGYRDMVLKAKDGVVLDLGANVGMLSVYAGAVAKRVYAFEPSHADALQKVLDATHSDRVMVCPFAIAAVRGVRTFYQNQNRTADSFYRIDNTAERMVGCWTLLDILVRFQLSEVALVKMDIEGAEAEVIRHPEFAEAAKHFRSFYVECHNFADWGNGEALVQEMAGILRQSFPHVEQTGYNNLYATRD